MQDWLWIPALRELTQSVAPPLRVLCLPGRECRFLLKLLAEGLTDLSSVTCVERDSMEALLIRGVLAGHAGSGRATIDLAMTSVYEYLTAGEQAVERRYHVIDLDPYGRVADEGSDLLDSVAAVLDVQARANVREWLLLLQSEVASARGENLMSNLAIAERTMMGAAGAHLERHLDSAALADTEPHAQLVRYAACVGACIVENSYPRFEARLFEQPMFYRGSDDYGVPSKRALMGGFALRLVRPRRPTGFLGQAALASKIEPLADDCIRRCLKAKAVVALADGSIKSFKSLSKLSFC